MRAVIDTNVIIQAMISGESLGAKILEFMLMDKFSMIISTTLWNEYKDVSLRPKISEMILPERRDAIISAIYDTAFTHRINYEFRPMSNDPEDEHIIDLAINAEADIVTNNLNDFSEVESKFNVRVFSPADFWRTIK